MRTVCRFTALKRMAFVGMITLAVGGSNPFPLTAAANAATVTLTPAGSTVAGGGTVAYYAAVTGSESQTITWFVDGVAKGNSTVGALTANGNAAHMLYTAPAVSGSHTVKTVATNAAGASVSGSTTVTVQSLNTATVTLTPATSTVACGGTVAYYSAVSGSASQTITWFVDGVANGNSTVGALTLNGNVAHMLYTAPATGGSHTVKAVATNAAGATTSGQAALTVASSAPVILSFTSSPSTITAGQGSILTWTTSGTTKLSIAPSVGDVTGLSSKNASPAATTIYTLTGQNAAGQTVTANTTVTVNAAPAAPTIKTQPQSVTVTEGQPATFTVSATSTATLSYKWMRSGSAISGATSASYTTPATIASDSGANFTVAVTNSASTVSSSAATLTVTPASKAWPGFGFNTTGGTGKTVVHVTNLNDTGTGSFRAACGANRIIAFDVAGTIALGTDLVLNSIANVTIDGSTAPSPGITFTGHGISFQSSNNIIVTNIRHRGGYNAGAESGGCITFFPSCYNIVLDHLSLSGFQDEAIDFWNSNHDVTIQNCLVGAGMTGTSHNYECLIGHYPYNITVYHNVFANGEYRNPAVGYDDTGGTISPVLCAEVINNVTWKYTAYGITTYWGAKTNVTGNYLYTEVFPGGTNRAVNTDALGQSYATGNYSKDGSTVNGTNSTPFAVPAYAQIKATSASDAANYVKANAGCRVGGLDALDLTLIDDLTF